MTELLSEAARKAVREEPRFRGIRPVRDRGAAEACPSVYGEEARCVTEAFESGAACEYVDRLEKETAGYLGVKYGVAFGSGTAAMHMALRLAAERLYGAEESGVCYNGWKRDGLLRGRRVFCSDLAPAAAAAPVLYEGGEPVFIDASGEDWGMDPEVLEAAFGRYPDVKIVVMVHVYGFPGQIGKIKEICGRHGALLIEDACESLGAKALGKPVGGFGDYGVLGFHEGAVMPAAEGGMLFVDDYCEMQKAGRGRAGRFPGMGEAEAGLIRSRLGRLKEYIEKKKAIYERYEKRFSPDLMMLNPIGEGAEPCYRRPCMTVESSIGFTETRREYAYAYVSRHGTAAPMEILEALEAFGAGGEPVWKPLHMQPLFQGCDRITLGGSSESGAIFRKGICLPADVGMTEEEQDRVIDIIFACYSRRDLNREIWCV